MKFGHLGPHDFEVSSASSGRVKRQRDVAPQELPAPRKSKPSSPKKPAAPSAVAPSSPKKPAAPTAGAPLKAAAKGKELTAPQGNAVSGKVLKDIEGFLAELALLPDQGEFAAAAVGFDLSRAIHIGRAPGRLDVMGGIADYSGSLVLQMPIAEACVVALQFHPIREEERCHIVASSLGAAQAGRAPRFDLGEMRRFDMPTTLLWDGERSGPPTPLEKLRLFFSGQKDASWAAYVVGVLGILAHEPETQQLLRGFGGCSILVSSDVPEGKGVSSSAAVEVATMTAALSALGATITPPERIAQLCQRVENFVVGAPCGIMDQMACALGREGELLTLLCQPHCIEGETPIPRHTRFWGIDSGVRHSVGGSDYGTRARGDVHGEGGAAGGARSVPRRRRRRGAHPPKVMAAVAAVEAAAVVEEAVEEKAAEEENTAVEGAMAAVAALAMPRP